MQTSRLLETLQAISPFELQESWDNSGLLLGSPMQEFEKIILCLEIDAQILAGASKNTLFITHHPLIFKPLKTLNSSQYPTNLITQMIAKNQQCIAMHTNFDKTHFSDYVVRDILQLELESKDTPSYIATFLWEESFEALCEHIRDAMKLSFFKIATTPAITEEFNEKKTKKIALVTGAGASLFGEIPHLDCLISGDCKYHDAMIAHSLGVAIIDCGHYELERYFGDILYPILQNKGYEAIIAHSHNPFNYF